MEVISGFKATAVGGPFIFLYYVSGVHLDVSFWCDRSVGDRRMRSI